MQETATRWSALLDELHRSNCKVAIVVAGGGSGAIARCFGRAGASKTFIEATIPYSRASMTEYLQGVSVKSSASLATAIELAGRAQSRAIELCDPCKGHPRFVGLSLVAALPTDSSRRGENRIHVAMCEADQTKQWSLSLPGQGVSREFAETVSDEMIFRSLASLVAGHENDAFWKQAGLDPP